MSAHRTRRCSRMVSAVPAVGLVLVLAACGGSGSSGHSSMPGMSSTSATPSVAASESVSGNAGMPAMTYPAVTPGPAAAGAHNDADVAFAAGMIPHHGQAVQMADMILAVTSNAEAKSLAEQIKKAQSPEIAALSGWVKGWGQRVPDPYTAMAHDMPGMDMGGLISTEQMNQLHAATGTAADKVFLTLMVKHHQGAIEMSKTEVAKGTNAEAKKLGQSIITSQSAEITQMQKLLTAMG